MQGYQLGGTAGDNGRIFINDNATLTGPGPTLTNGLIGGWALAYNAITAGPGGIDFATYKTGQGVGNLGNTAANFGFVGYSGNALTAGTAVDNIRTTATVGGVTTRTINSFTIGGAATITLNSASDVLTIGTGGLLNQNVASTLTGGDVTSGGNELFVHNAGATIFTLNSRITGAGVALVKDLNGTLALNGTVDNTYGGGTYINNPSIATTVSNATTVTVGTGSTVTTGTADGLRYLGTGAVTVDQAFLTLGGIGATSFSGTLALPTYTALNMAQITIPGTKTFATTEVFSIGAGSIIAGGAFAFGQGLNSLTRGTNVVLNADAILAHVAFPNGSLGVGSDTIQNLGTNADLYYGLNANQNAGANAAITVGAGTPWKGISSDRSNRDFQQGTITANGDFYLQGLMVPAANATLTLGGTGGGTYSIVNATAGNVPIRAFVIGNVTLNENSAVTMPGNLTFVATPGATLLLAQQNSLGSNVDPALNAKLLLQAGSTLNLAGANGVNYLNSNGTFEEGARFLADDNLTNTLAGTGTMTFLPGSIIDITQQGGITGNQPIVTSPGTIVRFNTSSVTGISTRVGSDAVFEITSGNRTLTSQATPENLTISGGVLTNGGLGNTTPTSYNADGGNGKLIIGAGGAIFAATTNTTFNVNEDFDLQGNTLTIGSLDFYDGNPKLGIVALGNGGNTAAIGSLINVLPGFQLIANAQNVLPDLARLNLGAGSTLVLSQNDFIETLGAITGTGTVLTTQNGTIPGTNLRVGAANTSFSFDGSFSNTSGGNPHLTKMGTGTMDLTGVSTSTGKVDIDAGVVRLRDGAQTVFATYNVNRGGTLTLDNAVGAPLDNRLGGSGKFISVAGGTVNLIGSPSAPVTEAIGAFSVSAGGQGIVDIVPGAGGATTLSTPTLNVRSISTFLLRGEKLGAAPGAGVATFTAVTPSLYGTLVPNDNTSSTQALRPDILSDKPTAGGTSATLSFVTQDNVTNGFRMLTAAEYSNSIASYNNTNFNVALSAPIIIPQTSTLTTVVDTQIQSLVFNSGSSNLANNAGVTTTNAGARLVIKSGGVLVQSGVNSTITSPFIDQGNPYYFHTYGNLTVNASLLGANGFVKTGPGTLTLGDGALPYMTSANAGMFLSINEGAVKLGANNSFGTAIGTTVNAPDFYLAGGSIDINGNSQTFRVFTSENNSNSNLLPGTGGNLTNSGAPATLTVFSNSGGNGNIINVTNNLFTGTLSGPIDFLKAGTSVQGFNNLSTFAGTLTLRGGSLQLRDSGKFTGVTSLSASYSTLYLDNQYSLSNVANRVPANLGATMRGSGIELRGMQGENSIQSLGTVTLLEGSNLLSSQAQGNSSTDLIIANLVRSASDTIGVRFNGSNLGRLAPAGTMQQDSRVIFTQFNGSVTPEGFLGGWATVNDSDFAAYKTPPAVTPTNATSAAGVSNVGNTGLGYPAYTVGTATNFATGLIIDVTADTTLSAGDKTVGALRLSGGATRQLFFTGGTDLINIESGGLLRSNNNNTTNIGTAAIRGRITAGGLQSTGTANLFLHVNQGTANTINSAIVNNPNGAAVALIKDLGAQVDLTGANTYTGGTFVNGGTLRLNTPSADGTNTFAIPGALTINNSIVTLATGGQIKNNIPLTINGGGTLNLSNTAGDNLALTGLIFGNSGGGTPQITAPSATTAGTVTKVTLAGNITSVNDNPAATPTIQGTIANTQIQLDFVDNTTTRTIDVSGLSPIGLVINAPILNGKLLKTGSGMLLLNQPSGTGAVTSSYSGGLQIDAGVVRIDNIGALSTNPNAVLIGTGAALLMNSTTAVPSTVTLALNSGSLLAMNSMTFNGAVSIAGSSTISLSDYNVASTARSVTLNGQATGNGSINVPASPVSGQNGTLLLTNNTNSLSGAITLQRNAILTSQSTTGDGNTLGTASIAMLGGTLNLRDNGTASNITLPAYGNNLAVSGNSVLNVNRVNGANISNIYALGTLGLNNAALTVSGGSGYTVAFGTTTLTGTATINNSVPVSLPAVTGTGNLVKSDTATLNVTAPSSAFTGGTTVTAGTLRVAPSGGGAGLGTGALVIAGGATLQSDPTTGIVSYNPSSILNDGILQVKSGITNLGSAFINATPALTGSQPFSAFTELFSKPSDVGVANFDSAATGDPFITLENSNTFLTPNPGPGFAGPGVSGGVPLNFNQDNFITRSSNYFPGTTEQAAAYRGTITIGGSVPAGPVSFGTASDDGSTLYVDLNGDHVFTSNERVVSNFGPHAVVQQTGTVNLAAGTYDIAVAMYQGGGGGSIQATFNVGSNIPFGGQYTITPGGSLGSLSRIQIDANSQLIAGGFSTGTLALNSNAILTLPDAGSAVASSATTLSATSGVTVSLGANHNLVVESLSAAISGTLVKEGAGTLTVSNSFQFNAGRQLRIDEGTVLINGTASPGSTGTFLVNSGGTLGGTGDLGGAIVTVNSGGSLSPGNGSGTLAIAGDVTLNAGAKYVAELGGSTPGDGTGFYDQTLVGGTLLFDQAELKISNFGSYTPSFGSVFYILVANGGSFGQFAGLGEGATFTSTDGSLTGLITYQANWAGDQSMSSITGGNDVALYQVVPEPNIAALLFTGLVGVLARRRRRVA